MKLHHLKPAEGAKKDKKRVGRGRAGVRGKTAGRGTKGTGARKNVPAWFEGGQMPLQRRVPKLKGFTNPNRVEYAVVNVELLAQVLRRRRGHARGALRARPGRTRARPVKVLARGELDHALTVKAHAFSEAAKAKIEAAGGRAELIGVSRGTIDHRAEGLPQRVPGPGPPQQDPLHAGHHRRLPVRRARAGAGRRHRHRSAGAIEDQGAGGFLSFINLFSGGALTRMAVFGLGIMPYITSSIIMQLLTVVIPQAAGAAGPGRGRRQEDQPVDALRHGGPGAAPVDRPRVPVPLRAAAGSPTSSRPGTFTWPNVALIVLTLTAGTAMIMWLGELITQRGVGNGMSILIFTSVISSLPAEGDAILRPGRGRQVRRRDADRPRRSSWRSCSWTRASGGSRSSTRSASSAAG